MKKLIIGSAICVFPVFILGIVNPVATLLNNDGKLLNTTIFFVYIGILSVCLSVILTTVLLLQKYASKIDHLDEEERSIYEQKRQLNTLISKYNDLIAGCAQK